MKILLSAFSCAPDLGSEPGIGWTVAREVARVHETWLFTDAANQPFIVPALTKRIQTRLHVVYISVPWPLDLLREKWWGHHLYYVIWQLMALRVGRSLHARVRFDVVHHVTYGNSWLPTWLTRLGAPFIWSAGGRDPMPWRFLRGMSWKGRLREVVRNVVLATLGRLTVRQVGSRAHLILTASEPSRWPQSLPVVRMAVGGLPEDELQSLAEILPHTQGPFRMLSVGRLLGLKGFHLGLEAFARLQLDLPESEYWIVGDGPERDQIERRARDLDCIDGVRMVGWLPRRELWRWLGKVDVLVHPSLHEQFGYVIAEAMAAGRPVICLDVGGPPLVVGDSGIIVPVCSPDQVVANLHSALLRLARNRALAGAIGDGGRRRAEEVLSWNGIGRDLLRQYEAVASLGAIAGSTGR